MHLLFLTFALLCALLPITATSFAPPSVSTTSGTLIGFSPSPHVTAFYGIPYALPPIHDLRWEPPQPFKKSAVPINATQFGPACIQFQIETPISGSRPNITESEDCLTLNIWVPSDKLGKGGKKGEKGLPSMVWIHGGGFTEGSGSEALYNGATLAERYNVIIVTLNYRLNIFGFPTLPFFPNRNLGLLDQRLAVEWLYKNLPSFGGDPKKMTLAGESAGSVSINSYAYAYPERPLVRAFIMQSGFIEMLGDTGPEGFLRVAEGVGCTGTDEEIVACMKGKDATEIRKTMSDRRLNDIGVDSGGLPGVDNKTVWPTEELVERGLSGRFAKLPTLLGSNEHEGDLLVPFDPEKGINYTLSDIVTKAFFDCPSSSQSLYRSKNAVPVYRYRYQGNLPSLRFYPWLRSAYHAAELFLLFDALQLVAPNPQPWELKAARYLQDTWMAFVKDPARGLKKRGWPLYNPKKRTLVELLPEQSPGYRLADPSKYDGGCDNPPRIPWEDFGLH